MAMLVYCENLSSIGCLVAKKSLCGWAQAEIWWVAQQNRVTPSPFEFGLWTLDLDCDNYSEDVNQVTIVECKELEPGENESESNKQNFEGMSQQ